jgi:diadenosine tetraphosphate (Ap4A) HIT family hydrolase
MDPSTPKPVPETELNADDTPSTPITNPDCPFCSITTTYPPIFPLSPLPQLHQHFNPSLLDPPAYVLLSTPHLIAFLDIYPLTRGHILICPRRHAEKLGDLTPAESMHVGAVLPLLCRGVMRAVMPDVVAAQEAGEGDAPDYNLVQNNGPGAAQVVPHVHWHLVPRYPFDYVPSPLPTESGGGDGSGTGRRYPPNEQPEGLEATRILFGRGQRHYRDEEESEALVKVIRERVREEWTRTFPGDQQLVYDKGELERERERLLSGGRGASGGKL